MKISSKAFIEGGIIPAKYSCEGDNKSPPIEWEALPQNTKSLALVLDDPDAPMIRWVHWVVYNIPIDQKGLPEGIPPENELMGGIKQGINNWRKIGYGGPCPPWGTHRYVFKLYALDKMLDVGAGMGKSDLLKEIKGHIIDEAELVGKYSSNVYKKGK